MASQHIIHESEVDAVQLTGRSHKMVIKPGSSPCESMCFGVAEFPPQSHAPAHVHKQEEEVIYILSGHGAIYFDGEPESMEAGSCIAIPKGVEHSIRNDSSETMKLAYVFSPPVVQGSYERKQ